MTTQQRVDKHIVLYKSLRKRLKYEPNELALKTIRSKLLGLQISSDVVLSEYSKDLTPEQREILTMIKDTNLKCLSM